MNGERKVHLGQFFSAQAANAAATALNVLDFDSIVVFVGAPAGSTLTLKALGSINFVEPTDWEAAPSVTNKLDGQLLIWNSDGTTTVKGNTGIVLAAAAHARMYRVNTENLHWLNFVLSGFGAGSVTVDIIGVRKNR